MTYHYRNLSILAGAALGLSLTGSAGAGITFFSNNPAGFAAAMSGNTFLGTETFEESNLAAGSMVAINDPLTQGVANGPYPLGLLQPLTVQANGGGAAAAATNPRGVSGLAGIPAGTAGSVSDIVISNVFVDSLDWIFSGGTQITGIGLNPLSLFNSSTLEIEVYNAANALLGATTIIGDPAGTNFLGIQATGGDVIGRVNFFSTSNQAEGGDNAALFIAAAPAQLPEPASLGLLGIAFAAFGASRRRKKT